ncbi:MAG: hypothetical protein ACRDS9_28800 [Pseudonocardiaceae bacterium]
MGVFAVLFAWEKVGRHRDGRRMREERAELELAWSRDLWATITALGPLLGELRSTEAASGGQSVEMELTEAAVEQASRDYQRSLQEAIRRFPDSVIDAAMAVALTWTTVELHRAADEIAQERTGQELDAAEMQRHVAAHGEALGVLQILVTNKHPELSQLLEPVATAGPAAAGG